MNTVLLMYDDIEVAKIDAQFNLEYINKHYEMNDWEDFIIDRIPARNRRDIERLLFQWGINEYSPYEIALKTRLLNPMDKYWIRMEEHEVYHEMLYDYLHESKECHSPSGNNIKKYYWKEERFGIAKKRLSPVIMDNESELICYRLARLLGVACCPTYKLDDEWIFSEYQYDFNKDSFRHVRRDISPYTGNLFKDLLRTYPALHKEIYQMILFDFITRQDDRHRSNIAVVDKDGIDYFYPLYDNGRSLFFEDREEFIAKAVENIEIYSTSFGEIGTYFDYVQQIPHIAKLINLEITEEDVSRCFENTGLPMLKVYLIVKWIMQCINHLRGLAPNI